MSARGVGEPAPADSRPGYSPDLNPIERLWDWLRDEVTRGHCHASLAALKAACLALPKRWVVERSIGWVGRNRRRSRDHEHMTGSSQAWIQVGAIGGMRRRLAPDPRWRSASFRCLKTPVETVA